MCTVTVAGETLRSDNGVEYFSKEFRSYLRSRGNHQELTVPHSPQQNGVAERMNRTLTESARSMMAHAKLSDKYWAEAVACAAYLRNRTPTSALQGSRTPLEVWSGRKPDISHLRVFGCVAYAHVPDSQRQKLNKKAVKLRFVGYSTQSKGYRLIDERTSVIYTCRDVVFSKQDFGHAKQVTVPDSVEVLSEEVREQEPHSDPVPEPDSEPERRRQSEHVRHPPVRYGVDEYKATVSAQHIACTAHEISEPLSMDEALNSDFRAEWKKAADYEYHSLLENNTWELVPLPSGRQPIGSKWLFKVKHTSDGTVERFKARLVAKGYAQTPSIDYGETFSPVVKFQSIRVLLALAAQYGLVLHQMDVVTAFLNGDLDETIYMQQPDGYVQKGKEQLVCKLNKSLYGLKQSPRCWNKVFAEFMRSFGFNQSAADPCIYIRDGNSISVVAVYADDLIIATKTVEEIETLKQLLQSQFKMKDIGESHSCLLPLHCNKT